jgi:hypothetical protein
VSWLTHTVTGSGGGVALNCGGVGGAGPAAQPASTPPRSATPTHPAARVTGGV